MTWFKKDLLTGIIGIVVCVILFTQALDLQVGDFKFFLSRPDVWVWLMLGILAVLCVLLIISTLLKKDKTESPPVWNWLGVFTVGALAVYLWGMEYIGYFLATGVFLSVLIVVYSLHMDKLKTKDNEKKDKKTVFLQILLYIVFSFVASIIVDYVFRNILYISLPEFNMF